MSQHPLSVPLGPGAEFDRIRGIWQRLGDGVRSAGDDCAIVEIDGALLAIGTDLALEDVHFSVGWMQPHEIGWRAAAAALSDLAAMGAEPAGVLTSLGVSGEWPEEFVTDVMEGVGNAASAVGAVLWGGDLVCSERLVIDVVVVGRAHSPIRRVGARPGDGLWVTGALGAPQAALEAWTAGREPDAQARQRFVRPIPRVREAQWLGARGTTAMLDVSDGLVGDAGHLAAASGVRCSIDADRVPVHPAADTPAQALVSGEEYELLLTLPAATDSAIARAFEDAFGIPLTRIGSVESGEGIALLEGGVPVDIPAGFRHF